VGWGLLARRMLRATLVATGLIAAVALAGATVRLLPWLVDPQVPWRAAAPFARTLVASALEVALLVGWPVGWALGHASLVESGEARVLQTLGERPARTLARLVPQAAVLAFALGLASFVAGEGASAPGMLTTELLEEARASCEAAEAPTSYAVPLTGFTWLCAPGSAPRLVGVFHPRRGEMLAQGSSPSAPDPSDVFVSATRARVAGDFQSVELTGVHLERGTGTPPFAELEVESLHVRGFVPFGRAARLAPMWRALVFGASAALSAWTAAAAVLRLALRGRFAPLLIAAAGPLAVLVTSRAFERSAADPRLYAAVPVVALAAPLVFALVVTSVTQARGKLAAQKARC